jgi:hypothetical protein
MNEEVNNTNDNANDYSFEHSFQAASEQRINPAHLQAYPNDESATLRLLEERLLVDRYHRRKVGEVIVRKVVETHIVKVPVRREKLVVEQVSPERKQLASINLNGGEWSGVELTQVTQETKYPETNGAFVDAKVASRILDEVTENPVYRSARVSVSFEDETLQSVYEQWLKRHLTENGY